MQWGFAALLQSASVTHSAQPVSATLQTLAIGYWAQSALLRHPTQRAFAGSQAGRDGESQSLTEVQPQVCSAEQCAPTT